MMNSRAPSGAVERIAAIPHPQHPTTRYIPRINSGPPGADGDANKIDRTALRPFRPDDMPRVLDFDGMPPPPHDSVMLHGEMESSPGGGGEQQQQQLQFVERVVVLRGSYLFLYDPDDVDDDDDDTNAASDDKYIGPPLGVVPLDGCAVDFPPGGRRVFREHAMTDARSGYEFLVRHLGTGGGDNDGGGTKKKKNCRAPQYLVASSLSQREEWAAAIRIRSEASRGRVTRLRPGRRGAGGTTPTGGSPTRSTGVGVPVPAAAAAAAAATTPQRSPQSATSPSAASPNPFDDSGGGRDRSSDSDEPGAVSPGSRRRGGGGASVKRASNGRAGSAAPTAAQRQTAAKKRGGAKSGAGDGDGSNGGGGGAGGIKIPGRPGTIDAAALGVAPEERSDVNNALRQFGQMRFDEAAWIEDFFKRHNEYDAPGMVRKLEKWQGSMKKGLRGAVLEQYEYFVEANKEMTTMGREVATLRHLVDTQLETVQGMRTIDFAAAFADPIGDDYSYYSGDDMMGMDDMSAGGSSMGSSVEGALTANGGGGDGGGKEYQRQRSSGGINFDGSPDDEEDEEDEGSLMEVPSWLNDVTEEVTAFIRFCRYTDATDLILRARSEVTDVLSQHERLTEKRLGKKQLSAMQRILNDLDGLSERLGNRLAEGLRRKNEALKQTIKRERADPLSVLAPLVSPVCLNDDAIALQLLVKLGRSNDAATAYSARRSLLLMECLNERPIASGSSSGTMDVVIYAAQLSQSFFSCLSQSVEGFLDLFLSEASGKSKSSDLGSSFDEMSSINSGAAKKVPAGAISAVVLWCDSELSKFAAAFGGTRVLGNLPLSPPTLGAGDSTRSGLGDKESIAELRKKLRDAEETGDYSAAAKVRSKLAEMEQDGSSKNNRSKSGGKVASGKEREDAIDVSAKCVDQAFQFASENLDSIGLPMTPRLAEYIRARLKGCEGEIAVKLQEKWGHLTFDWNDEGGPDIDDAHMRED